jgi:hypothetical protein
LKAIFSGIAASVLLAALCISCSQATGTGIEGTITISPSHPGPTLVSEPNAAPLKGVVFAVENESGHVTSFETDELDSFEFH